MPICLNLLAEAQAAEELRRQDPAKRATWIAALLVALMLVWSSSLQLKAMLARTDLNRLNDRSAERTNQYQQVLQSQKRSVEIRQKIAALDHLTANRFLNGTLLNALQQVTADDVQLVRVKASEAYFRTDAIKAQTNDDRVIPARPASVTERIVVTLVARDSSPNPGDQRVRFTQRLAGNPYFQAALGKTNEVRLISVSPPEANPAGGSFILFTLECPFPEKKR